MSELHKFLFDGVPVRGMVVRLTDAWVEILRRRASNSTTGAYPEAVQDLLPHVGQPHQHAAHRQALENEFVKFGQSGLS